MTMKLYELTAENNNCYTCQTVYTDGNNVYDQQYNLIGPVTDSQLDEERDSADWTSILNSLQHLLKMGTPVEDALNEVVSFYAQKGESLSTSQLYDIAQQKGVLDQQGNLLAEASKRQWKRRGRELYKRYRCVSGPKKGKLVSEPSKCASRKDPKKVRQGRKVMRTKKNTIQRKSKISKRRQLSKMVTRMNQRLMGADGKK